MDAFTKPSEIPALECTKAGLNINPSNKLLLGDRCCTFTNLTTINAYAEQIG